MALHTTLLPLWTCLFSSSMAADWILPLSFPRLWGMQEDNGLFLCFHYSSHLFYCFCYLCLTPFLCMSCCFWAVWLCSWVVIDNIACLLSKEPFLKQLIEGHLFYRHSLNNALRKGIYLKFSIVSYWFLKKVINLSEKKLIFGKIESFWDLVWSYWLSW